MTEFERALIEELRKMNKTLEGISNILCNVSDDEQRTIEEGLGEIAEAIRETIPDR